LFVHRFPNDIPGIKIPGRFLVPAPDGSVKINNDECQELLLLVEAGKKISVDDNGVVLARTKYRHRL
jgi:hypothetical protein